jgi:hypothetical protein
LSVIFAANYTIWRMPVKFTGRTKAFGACPHAIMELRGGHFKESLGVDTGIVAAASAEEGQSLLGRRTPGPQDLTGPLRAGCWLAAALVLGLTFLTWRDPVAAAAGSAAAAEAAAAGALPTTTDADATASTATGGASDYPWRAHRVSVPVTAGSGKDVVRCADPSS